MDSSSGKEDYIFFRHEASSDSLKSLYNEIDGIERFSIVQCYKKQLYGNQLGISQS